MTKEQEKELRRTVQALLDRGYSKQEILAEFAKAAETRRAELQARENSVLVKPQPPAVKAGNYDV